MNTYKLIQKIDDNYSVIDVIDQNNDTIRILKSSNSNQSVSYTDERRYQLYDSYSQLYDLSATFKIDVKNVLMLGGGGFSYSKYYISQYSNKKMTVVEINDELIEVANKYFFLEELYNKYDKNKERLKIYNIDAMDYLDNCQEKYDSIIVDLYTDLIPINDFFLMPVLEKMNRLLEENGCLCINYIITDSNIDDFWQLYNNLQKLYSNISLLSTNVAFQNYEGNIFIISSNQKVNFAKYYNYNIVDIETIKKKYRGE